MPDDTTHPTSPRRSHTRSRRRARFSLPPDHHEEVESERTTERIEAFLDGTPRVGRARRRPRVEGYRRPRPVVPLDTRADWERALRVEDARLARYGRPASVLIVDVTMSPTGGEDRFAARLGAAIRAQARETDRVARVGPARFHVLLPETDEHDAATVADRICRASRQVLPVPPGPAAIVRASVASPTDGGTLADALRHAQARLTG